MISLKLLVYCDYGADRMLFVVYQAVSVGTYDVVEFHSSFSIQARWFSKHVADESGAVQAFWSI